MLKIETKTEIGVFFEKLKAHLQEHRFFKNHIIDTIPFPDGNPRICGLTVSALPNEKNGYIYNIQFWKEWHEEKRVIIFALWADDNSPKLKEYKIIKSEWTKDIKSDFKYNDGGTYNYVDLSKKSIPTQLKNIPNEIDEKNTIEIIEKTLEKIYSDFNDKFNHLLTKIDKYEQIIKEYINYCKTSEKWEEEFKWKLVNYFQQKWNDVISDDDFKNFIIDIVKLQYNLIQRQFQGRTLIDLAKHFPKELKDILIEIYDDQTDVIERYQVFYTNIKRLIDRLKIKLNTTQQGSMLREETFALFLTCRYPEKYYFYNSGFYEKFANFIDQKPKNAGEKYKHYLEIMNYFRDKYVIKNSEAIEITQQKLPENQQNKDNISLITQSIIFLYFEVIKNNNSDEKTLISVLGEIDFENANNLYTLCDKLISELKIENGDERLHYNCTPLSNFNITVGQRYAIQLDTKSFNWDIIIPKETNILEKNIGFRFDGKPETISFRTNNFSELKFYEKEFIVASLGELNRTTKSGYRKSTNLAFEKSIFDIKYRNEIFNQIFEQNFISSLALNENIKTKKVRMPLNQILYGPPGTGKTYHTINKAIEIIDNEYYFQNKENRKVLKNRFKELKENGKIVFTTFHQSMSYEEFLESLKPKLDEKNQIYYDFEKGIFKEICEKAEEKPNENFVLIIDEINRGNIASIFGELITLIEPDKRNGADEELSVKLPYSKKDFAVPQNLYIIGTMNTADRSVEALDTALRRRFVFSEMPPKMELLDNDFFGVNLQEVLKWINIRIEKLIDKDHKIGHSYFMNLTNENDLQNAFKNKIIPLLEEYFYGDFAKIGLVLGSDFITKINFEENIFKNIDDIENYTDFENKIIYKAIVPDNIENFKIAVKNIYL